VIPIGETDVVAFSLEAPERVLASCERSLSPDERARAERFRFARDRRRYVVAHTYLRVLLARFLDREPASVRFQRGTNGKPALADDGRAPRVRFNLSRSHELGLLAIQLDDEVGVDLERVRAFADALPVAERFFAAAEHQMLCALPERERDAAFFGFWTCKEAILKCIGLGLSHPMNTFTLSAPFAPAGRSPERVTVITGEGTSAVWSLSLPSPAPGYVASLATMGAPRTVRMRLADAAML
jgi:4'-phosphopantetheinyl transferase